MWKVDPSIKLIGVGQPRHASIAKHDPDQKVDWSEGMLEECADHMNYHLRAFLSRARAVDSRRSRDVIGTSAC